MLKIEMKFKACLLLSIVFFVFTSFKSGIISDWRDVRRNDSLIKEQKDKPLKIMVISDLNDSYGSVTYSKEVAAVIDRIDQIKPDIILCGGDMVAGQKASLTEERLAEMWQAFNQNVLKPIDSLRIPFGFTMGNHDASPNFLKDRAAAKQFWDNHLPTSNLSFVYKTHYPFYYSYIKNNVFFMSWDASAAEIKPEVMEWMKEQLKSKVAKKSRLRILLGHLPLYAIVADKNKVGEVNSNADATLDFFKRNGVDLYISGHQHAYFPAHKNGVTLFNSGCLGGGPRPLLGHDEPAKKAYAIIEIPVKSPKQFHFDAFMPETNAPILLNSLPDFVQGFNGSVNRIDIP
jgi:Icc-related predicted phosphoesterase